MSSRPVTFMPRATAAARRLAPANGWELAQTGRMAAWPRGASSSLSAGQLRRVSGQPRPLRSPPPLPLAPALLLLGMWLLALHPHGVVAQGGQGQHANGGRFHEGHDGAPRVHANRAHTVDPQTGDQRKNKGHIAHHALFSFVVTGGKPAVLQQGSAQRQHFIEKMLRDLDAAMQADASTMHQRHDFKVLDLERWSKPGCGWPSCSQSHPFVRTCWPAGISPPPHVQLWAGSC
eukprot:COSAG01_NODE_1009_length_12151_cov_18.810571_10_plen_233_part_00